MPNKVLPFHSWKLNFLYDIHFIEQIHFDQTLIVTQLKFIQNVSSNFNRKIDFLELNAKYEKQNCTFPFCIFWNYKEAMSRLFQLIEAKEDNQSPEICLCVFKVTIHVELQMKKYRQFSSLNDNYLVAILQVDERKKVLI